MQPPLTHPTTGHRRNDHDVTGSVQVSSPSAVRDAVRALFVATWPGRSLEAIHGAFDIFTLLFSGRIHGYQGIDTVYHDRQHTLDAVLAMARLTVGHERTAAPDRQLGFDRAALGVIVALFHDAGYIRKTTEPEQNGAQLTKQHVSRSSELLAVVLPKLGLGESVPVARKIVHYTGYEIAVSTINVQDPLDHLLGQLVGTADLIAQMSDRCYLEKCRDRLYPEFVLGGLASSRMANGEMAVRYGSGLDLLRETPKFIDTTIRDRLSHEFGHAYRHVETLFGGENPYMEAIYKHRAHVQKVVDTGQWALLRRKPPLFTHPATTLPTVRHLVADHLRTVWGCS
jgi:hypothetical protein